MQECETKIAREIASLSKEDVSKAEMNENEEVINILLAQVAPVVSLISLEFLFFNKRPFSMAERSSLKHGQSVMERKQYGAYLKAIFVYL